MADRFMLPPNLGWGRRRGRGIPARQTVDPITENVVIPLSQPQNGTTANMIATMFQQAMESLVEKIQTQPQVNMMPEGNNGHNQSDEPLRKFIRRLIDPLFKPLASYLTKGDITFSQAVDGAREVETRWREERATKAQNKRTKTAGSFEGGIHTRCDSGSQSHSRTARTEGASVVQSSSSAPTKQNHKGSTPLIGQTNLTTITCPSCHKAHFGLCWREIGACLRCGQMGHYKRDFPRNHRGPS
ncbi:hypothetical protein HAX54_027544 [Datura stramonium]|uniref:CCHC-type domain-containing protein n=1 Tax=Datura stramonium TaxID=4076 RepID=A0ABS8V558_DATST|nr:hypothetical protein [Datura stramonium]